MADQLVEAQHSKDPKKKAVAQQNEGEVQQILLMVKKTEKIDKPNCMLFKARILAYLEENDSCYDFGKGF
jgi:hypothetical protein